MSCMIVGSTSRKYTKLAGSAGPSWATPVATLAAANAPTIAAVFIPGRLEGERRYGSHALFAIAFGCSQDGATAANEATNNAAELSLQLRSQSLPTHRWR